MCKAILGQDRFSGGTHGFVVGHITPEAFLGGTIALVKDGDLIAIDAKNNTINLKVSEQELEDQNIHFSELINSQNLKYENT